MSEMNHFERYTVALAHIANAVGDEMPNARGIRDGYDALMRKYDICQVEKALALLVTEVKWTPRPMDVAEKIESWQIAAPYHALVEPATRLLPSKQALLDSYKGGYGRRLVAKHRELLDAKIEQVGWSEAMAWSRQQERKAKAGYATEAERALELALGGIG